MWSNWCPKAQSTARFNLRYICSVTTIVSYTCRVTDCVSVEFPQLCTQLLDSNTSTTEHHHSAHSCCTILYKGDTCTHSAMLTPSLQLSVGGDHSTMCIASDRNNATTGQSKLHGMLLWDGNTQETASTLAIPSYESFWGLDRPLSTGRQLCRLAARAQGINQRRPWG